MRFISVSTRLFKWPGRLAREGRGLAWWFVAANMVPSVCLAFTEPLGAAGLGALLLAPLGAYLLVFGGAGRPGVAQLWLTPLLVFHAFQLVLFYLYGESVIAVDMFLNLPTTNATEAGELLGNLWPSIIIVCALYVPTIGLAAWSARLGTRSPGRFRRRTAAAGLAALVVGGGLAAAQTALGTGYRARDGIYPVNIFHNLGYAAEKWRRSEAYPETSRAFTFGARRDTSAGQRREAYVLVIGEASRAENWELFGYGRPTNPRLRGARGLVAFPDAVTQSNATHKSVPLILSAADAAHYERLYTQKSVVTAFKEAGFSTVFLSNQVPNRSFTDYFAAEADVTRNVRARLDGGLVTVNNYDGAMVPLLERCLDSLAGDVLVVMHTYGSHFNYRERYPEGFGAFKPDEATDIELANKAELVNAYDNSVLYTDLLLDSVTRVLERSGRDAALFYTPDHGEDLLDDRRRKFLHASPNPTYYQLHIPMLVWFSEGYRAAHPERWEAARRNRLKPVSTKAAFHTLLDLARIRTPWLDTTASVVSAGFTPRPRMYLNDHDEPVNYFRAGLKREDLEMLERRGMDRSE